MLKPYRTHAFVLSTGEGGGGPNPPPPPQTPPPPPPPQTPPPPPQTKPPPPPPGKYGFGNYTQSNSLACNVHLEVWKRRALLLETLKEFAFSFLYFSALLYIVVT